MYRAPVKDIRFVLDELIGTEQLRACPEFAEYGSETSDAGLKSMHHDEAEERYHHE
jgi:hypothetical protein